MTWHRSIALFLCLMIVLLLGATNSVAQAACSGDKIFTQAKCIGDEISPAEHKLFDLVDQYRKANGKPAVKLSSALSMIANRRMLDLHQNMKTLTHSWSNCRYDISDEKTLHCVMQAPQRLNSGYKGLGYETIYRRSGSSADPADAIETWKKSSLHNSIILNLGTFKDLEWDELGVAMDGQYAALWFGTPNTGIPRRADGQLGLGSTFEESAAEISKVLSIEMAGSKGAAARWIGTTSDKVLTVDLSGASNDVTVASLVLRLRFGNGVLIDRKSHGKVAALLTRIFPEWGDAGSWLDISAAAVAADPSTMKAKVVRKITVELKEMVPERSH